MISMAAILLSSCSGYRGQWSCRPAKGVPCTPVTEIEAMIIESSDGPNIFLGSETNQKAECGQEQGCGALSLSPKVERVWIPQKFDGAGKCLKGFYLYLNAECKN